MFQPRFSIIIPTLNRLPLLRETLDSLHYQTFSSWEALVVDDGSTDGTDEYVLEFSRRDARIRYIQNSGHHSGAPACRNLGTQLSQGGYIIYVDSDDCLASNALEQRFQAMETSPHLDFCLSPCIGFQHTFGDMGVFLTVETENHPIDRFLNFDGPWQTMVPTWRRDALIALGPWDEDLLCFQDHDLHLRALSRGYQYRYLANADCFWRLSREDNISNLTSCPSRLGSHTKFLGQIQTYLTEADLLTPERQKLLRMQYFWLVDHWALNQHQQEASALWNTGHDRGIFNHRQYWEGLFYIYLSSQCLLPMLVRRVLRKIIRAYFSLTWQHKLLPDWQSTYLKISVPPEQIAALNLERQKNFLPVDKNILSDNSGSNR